MPTTPEAWDRQPGESEAAYKAFVAYRDMGAARNVRDAYRQLQRKPGAIQADGTWNRWATAHDWKARVLAWDNHLGAAATRARRRVADQEGEKWARRLGAQAEADFAFAQKYAAEVARRLNDGATLPLMSARELKACMDVTVAASGLAWSAIAQALPDIGVDIDPHTAPLEQVAAEIERLDRIIGAATARPRIPRIARTE